jgi:hypothetical protein
LEPCSVITRLTLKTHAPQSRPASVIRQTCASVRAPELTASVTNRSLTRAQWQMITALSSHPGRVARSAALTTWRESLTGPYATR